MKPSEKLLEKYGPMMKPTDVANYLGMSEGHVRDMCNKGVLPAIKIGGRWRIATKKFAEAFDNLNWL